MRRAAAVFVMVVLVSAGVVFAETAADLIRAGDEAYARFDDAGALAAYEKAAKLEPDNYEALWKTARAYFDVGDRVDPQEKGVKEKKIMYYTAGEDYGLRAVRANPTDTWGHFFYAASIGRHALLLSKKEQVARSRKVKAELDKAVELDPKNDLAWHALGHWQRTMAEIGGAKRFFGSLFYGDIPKGTFQESVKDFQKAIELNPQYTDHHLELGRTYLDMKRKDLAAREFQKCLDAPIVTSKCEGFKKEARQELARLKG